MPSVSFLTANSVFARQGCCKIDLAPHHVSRAFSLILQQPPGQVIQKCLIFLLRVFMSTVPITKYGAELLKEELQRLKTKERPAVINAIAEARAQGDLSENAEYDAAKERQAFIEGRIADLEGKLGSSLVVDPATLSAGADGRVVFAATVDLENLDSGEKSPIRSSVLTKRISRNPRFP